MGERRNAASLFSHSLKTPLSSVKVASQLLLKHLQGKLSEKDQQLLEMILRNAGVLEARVNKLMELSIIDEEMFHLELNLDQLEVVHSLKEETPASKPAIVPVPEPEPAAPAPASDKIVIHADPEIADLIPRFLENRVKDIELIQEALDKDDWDTARIIGHSMKGAGGGYGFPGITDIGRVLEDAAKIKDVETIRKGLNDLSVYLNSVEVVYDEL